MSEKKYALVTGASRGIGKEIALTLSKKGFSIIVNYYGLEEETNALINEIKAAGNEAIGYECDVSNYNDVKDMIDYILETCGGIDVLVNNAGITKDNIILKMKEEEFDQVLNINLKGAFNTCKHVMRSMIKRRQGRIINISSISGIVGNAGQANYSSAKAGLIGLTKTLAKEVASRGITVNAVAPGFVETDMTKALPEQVIEDAKAQIPLRRLGTPKDIADMVCYLATNEGNYITGQVFQVDGGMVI